MRKRTDEASRFWPKVDKTGDCWEWTAGKTKAGYGKFRVGSQTDGTRRLAEAHRWAYEHSVGPIPEGLELDHLCRNRACVNPAHLEPVTRRVNCLRGEGAVADNARKTHCPKGHAYVGDNVLPHGKDGTARKCRECRKAYDRQRYYANPDRRYRDRRGKRSP